MKDKYKNFYWDLSEKDETEKLRWALSQYKLLLEYNTKGKNMGQILPDIGTDEGGSSCSFDLWLILQSETEKLLE